MGPSARRQEDAGSTEQTFKTLGSQLENEGKGGPMLFMCGSACGYVCKQVQVCVYKCVCMWGCMCVLMAARTCVSVLVGTEEFSIQRFNSFNFFSEPHLPKFFIYLTNMPRDDVHRGAESG